MNYCEYLNKYNKDLCEDLERAIELEKITEILLYKVIDDCVNNLDNVSVLVEKNDPIYNILKYLKKQKDDFGKNALKLEEQENGLLLKCEFNMKKLKLDFKILKSMFGNLQLDDSNFEENIDLSDKKINTLFSRIKINN